MTHDVSEAQENKATANFVEVAVDPLTSKILKDPKEDRYAIQLPNGHETFLNFQNGHPAEGVNGITVEALLQVALHRLTELNEALPSPFNDYGIAGIQVALDGLQARTEERLGTGIWGTELAEADTSNLSEPAAEILKAIKLYKRATVAAGANVIISTAFEKFEEQPDFNKVYSNLEAVAEARNNGEVLMPEFDSSIPAGLIEMFKAASTDFEEIFLAAGQTAVTQMSVNMVQHTRMQQQLATAQQQADAELAKAKANAEAREANVTKVPQDDSTD